MKAKSLVLPADPCTVHEAREAGLSKQVLRGARWQAPFRGTRSAAATPMTLQQRCHAALLVLPGDVVFSHDTAVQLWGLPQPWRRLDIPQRRGRHNPIGDDRSLEPVDAPLHATVPCGRPQPRLAGVVGHRRDLHAGDWCLVTELPVTGLVQTWSDVAASWQVDDLVVLADAILVHSQGIEKNQLWKEIQLRYGQRGVSKLWQAWRLARCGSLSAAETQLRLLLHRAGFPEPCLNRWIREPDGQRLHAPDLSWPQQKVAVEYDGWHHLQKDADLQVQQGKAANRRARLDIARAELLREHGWTVLVATAYDLYRSPARFLRRVRKALRET